MKLSYHGNAYTFVPQTLETIETEVTCQFLGQKTTLRVAKRLPTETVRRNLKYRGVSYRA